ncbi:MAG: rRNA maturation RNase YbeY [Defluviitaleaceae bacterium]|nr:rRNA maturation RNase YbeY [Defluviitaleaceae bacterium]
MQIYWEDKGKLNSEQLSLLNQVAIGVNEFCDFPGNSEVSISIMDMEEIQVLNRDYRGKNTPTDVLSFPVDENLAMGPEVSLGDIVICIDVAQRQAEEYGHSIERELAFLVVHGMLHLHGYAHETTEDEAEMMAAQDEILMKHGLHRE